MDEHQPVYRETVQRLAAAGMPVTRIKDEIDPVDPLDRLGGDGRRVDRTVRKAQKLERDPDPHGVSAVAGEPKRVAGSRDGPARGKSGGAGWDGEQVR